MTKKAVTYLAPLLKSLAANADKERAAAMSAYMKNRFSFFGISSPERRAICNSFIQEYAYPAEEIMFDVVQLGMEQKQREVHYFVIELLVKKKKLLASKDLAFLKALALQESWWDSIDTIGPKLVGYLVEQDPKLIKEMDKWAIDKNFWIRRIAILHQLKWKQKTDFERLCRYCLLNEKDKEFFIQKAMGWALREYAYVNPEAVIQFVNANNFANLTKREALKHFPNLR